MNDICSINQKWVREPSPDPLKEIRREINKVGKENKRIEENE